VSRQKTCIIQFKHRHTHSSTTVQKCSFKTLMQHHVLIHFSQVLLGKVLYYFSLWFWLPARRRWHSYIVYCCSRFEEATFNEHIGNLWKVIKSVFPTWTGARLMHRCKPTETVNGERNTNSVNSPSGGAAMNSGIKLLVWIWISQANAEFTDISVYSFKVEEEASKYQHNQTELKIVQWSFDSKRSFL